MIFTVASGLTYVNKRILIDVFPESWKKVWKEGELRGLIVVSLMLQIILTTLGKRRKYISRTWIRFILWSSYLMADWIATVALGVISNNSFQDWANSYPGSSSNNNCNKLAVDKELISFWAPFLLLHLGGPDTITAYSLEDNQLWLRHLLGLVVQTGAAIYILLLAWPDDRRTLLPILSIPIFIAGLIKYGERTWALRSANTEQLRESMLTRPDPGPNYAKFMEEYTLKKAEGFHVGAAEVIEAPVPYAAPSDDHRLFVLKASFLFQKFKRLFVDLILSFQDLDISREVFKDMEAKEAFQVVAVELGFAFDVLYTKAPVIYTVYGCLLRLASFSSTLSVLVAFYLLIHRNKYHAIDLVITYLLLVVAIVLEVYSVVLMIRSDWTDDWLNKMNIKRDFLVVSCLKNPEKLWWSNSMGQNNLLSFSLRRDDEPAAVCLGIQKLLGINQIGEKHHYKDVSPKLKELIYKYFLNNKSKEPAALCTQRGSYALKEHNRRNGSDIDLEWSISKIEFDQSILIWHIATDLCNMDGTDVGEYSEESNMISDYMLYLLVMCPALLPIGIGKIRFQDTCAEARDFFEERSSINSKPKACEKLLQVNTEVLPVIVKGDRSKSVLFDACRLAKSLRTTKEKKWEILSEVWVEMLAYAANRCRGNHHAQQLRKGGELLTHVWLLMAHLGVTEQFQISQGHARAKLVVK